MVQWLGICLPMRDDLCSGRFHMPRGSKAHVLQLLKPAKARALLHDKRSHHNEKPVHHD